MRAPLKKVFLARYVILAETAGYVIAAALLTLWGAFFFIKIDEKCFGTGPVKSAVLDLDTPGKAVVDELKVSDGDMVKKGQELLRLNLNDKAIAARQAQADLASLGAQIVTLANTSAARDSLKTGLASMVQQVGALPTGQQPQDIKAPSDGTVRFSISTGTLAVGTLVQGIFGEVVSNNMLQVDAKMGEMNRDRMAVGQPVIINVVLENGEKSQVMGKVIKKPAADQVIAAAEVTDPALSKRLSAESQQKTPAVEPLKAEVKVVVGSVKLVRFLFPNQSAAKTSEKKEGIWATVKSWWHKVF